MLGRFADVSTEHTAEKIDVVLTFIDPCVVHGIEATSDHALMQDQVDRELTVALTEPTACAVGADVAHRTS